MDLNTTIQDESKKYLESEDFASKIKHSVINMINKQVDDLTSSYSPMAKNLKDYIDSQVVINTDDLPAIGLVDMMIETMNHELDVLLKGELKKRVIDRVSSITKPVPKTITMMEVLKEIYNDPSKV